MNRKKKKIILEETAGQKHFTIKRLLNFRKYAFSYDSEKTVIRVGDQIVAPKIDEMIADTEIDVEIR